MHPSILSGESSQALAVLSESPAGAAKLTAPQKERRHALVVPREHGAWGMLLVPLVTGGAVGMADGGRIAPVLLLIIAVLTLFWLRTPAESWLGTSIIRAQTPDERRHVLNYILPLATVAATSLSALFWQGKNQGLIALGVLAGAAFAAQIVLKKTGRAVLGQTTRMATEIVGAIALTSTAPAAYYVATGRLDAKAWSLWLLNWLFAAGQVHFVWLRIRGARATGWNEKFTIGWSFLAGQFFLVGVLFLAYHLDRLPAFALIAFAPLVFRGLTWFAKEPKPVVVRHIGWTELAHALLFGFLLIAGFALRR